MIKRNCWGNVAAGMKEETQWLEWEDMTDDTVIVEFGSNKNCRIPMQKAAIIQVEKPESK